MQGDLHQFGYSRLVGVEWLEENPRRVYLKRWEPSNMTSGEMPDGVITIEPTN